MNQLFVESFLVMFEALARIFLIAVVAGVLIRKNIISSDHIKGLSELTVKILLPALIFANTLATFKPDEMPDWWILPLLGIGVSLLGIGIAYLLFIREIPGKQNLIPMAGLQNAGYLVLPLGQIIYPDQFDLFALYCFLFIMGFNPVLWSLGKLLSTSDPADFKFEAKQLITPPLVANIFVVLLVLAGGEFLIPKIVFDSVKLIGEATVPMATFILGATLGAISLRQMPGFWDTVRIIFVKFGLVPLVVIGVLVYFNIKENHPLMADFLVIEASAAPAANIIVMVRNYGGDVQKIGSTMLIAYLLSMLMMPFWLGVWKML